jgi:hypothetical protein
MHSLAEKSNELRQHLKGGISSMKHTGFDPVYYLVFPAEEMLQAKLALPQFLAQLKLDGFQPRVLSLTRVLNDWFRGHKLRAAWQDGLSSSDNDRQLYQRTFSEKLDKEQVLTGAILAEQEALRETPGGILLITDIEALHPFVHISGIEQQLTGRFKVPTVVFYPGTRGGSHSLRFLGIHKENGNYRSVHIG